MEYYQPAQTLEEIDYAVRIDMPIDSNHPYFTDFSSVRGSFNEKSIYKAFNINTKDFTFNPSVNAFNKTLLFLGGMRGSGKTSEIAKYVLKLDKPDCFFCVVCNIDKELDLNDVEYTDILILQLEKLIQKADDVGLELDNSIIKSMQEWFGERIKEINKSLTAERGMTLEVATETPSLLSFLKLALKLKAGVTGSRQTADKIRTSFKNNFIDFAKRFNHFIEETNFQLRKQKLGQEILFVVDGIEKTMTPKTREEIIINESNRLMQIKANTLFTLPIELMDKIQLLKNFANVASFPFVKIRERDDSIIETAVKKFEEFVYKRISPDLFDSPQTVRKAILLSGGSPRELLRIIEAANLNADEDFGKITDENLNQAADSLASECSHYLTAKDIEVLKLLKENNKQGKPTLYDKDLLRLFEHIIVFEYNNGSYKRVNPIVEMSQIYKEYVGE